MAFGIKISIGLPATNPAAKGQDILDWARAADEGPFTSLGIIDRVAYGNHEPMISLAAAAAVTRRIRLMTTILVSPLRRSGILAKQAATLDSISGGRFTLGVAVGARQDDFEAATAGDVWTRRGRAFEEQVKLMKRIWAGETPEGANLPVGPSPVQQGGPELLIGASSAPALKRAARLGDGLVATPNAPDAIAEQWRDFQAAWREEGREGTPRLVCGVYFTAGDDATIERGRAYVRDYYSFAGAETADYIANSALLGGAEQIKWYAQAMADIGADEVVFWPGTTDVEQVKLLADAVA